MYIALHDLFVIVFKEVHQTKKHKVYKVGEEFCVGM